ncbi:helix-turn-helix domain-containing protein [Novosphingobium terrae]|uniref:helix-turn-helix domain-containing protein n=1 Tax=Novosphingobium terrae TaxID=2726189 RepID=UPI001F13064C|nr:helix-turn-helix transcriptional regulator [Novosphingobium terrae]
MIISQLVDVQPRLTVRECEILGFVALGLSAKEIARHVSLAPRTVERYIENMRLKLRAKNSAHMVACGLFYGAISVNPVAPAV